MKNPKNEGHHWEPEGLPKPSAGARRKGAYYSCFCAHTAILAIKECSNQIDLKTKKFHKPHIYIIKNIGGRRPPLGARRAPKALRRS